MPKASGKRRKLGNIRSGVTKSMLSAKTSTSQKARSARNTTVDSARAAVESNAVTGVRSASGSAAKRAGELASQGTSMARDATRRGKKLASEGLDSARDRIPWDSVLPDDARSNLLSAVESSRALSRDAKRKMSTGIAPALSELLGRGMDSQAQIFSILQTSLAIPESSYLLNAWLQDIVKGTPTIYDKAMDAAYNSTRIGGGDHRLFDGGHTIAGAFQAVRNASPDDSIFEEAAGFLQALARDATTPRGLPLLTWDQETFNGLTDALGRVGIPRAWVVDMVSYDAIELIGASLGVLAIALNWNDDDVEEFSRLVGSMGLAAVVGANPLLLIVTVVALGRAFHTARRTGDWKEFTDGLTRGGICTGAVLLATSMVSGPAVVVLLTGICVGIVAQQASEKVSVVEIGQWVVVRLTTTPAETVNASAPAGGVTRHELA